ncbi:MAG: fused MFS/spermidine synthase [Acidobacteriota bacterium]
MHNSWHIARFYSVVIIPAGVLMALEIVSSRLLAPSFGNSVHVWGSIISVFLAAMSIGYVWGGRLADRHPNLPALGVVLLFSALAQTAVLFRGAEVVAYIGEVTGGSPTGTLGAAAVLFGLPTVLLAMVSPFAVRLAASDLELLGNTAGRLYALSTAGSLAGVLGATFYLVPVFDITTTLRMLAITTVVMASLAIGQSPRLAYGAALVVLLALTGRQAAPPDLLERRVTPYQTLEVRDGGEVRSLFSDRTVHASVRVSDGLPALAYARHSAAAFLLQPEIDDLLILGMGGGSVARYLQHHRPDLRAEFVDIDAAIPELARKHLFFDAPPESVHIDDARRFLARNPERRWDYIYVDTYIGASIPFHLATLEFFKEVRDHLNPGGLVGVNLATGPEGELITGLMRTIGEAFTGVHLFSVQGGASTLILAGETPGPLDVEVLAGFARQLEEQGSPFRPSLEKIALSYVPFEKDLTDATLFTDRFAPVNHLLRLDR